MIHENDSDEDVRTAVHKALNQKRRKSISLNKYFGKVSFSIDGLAYQKKLRDEWK